jgi:flagellar biosynthetic protein FliR
MTIDAALLFAFLMTFVRATSMMLVSPFFGGATPTNVRTSLCLVLAAGLTPVVLPYVGPVPQDVYSLAAAAAREAAIGVLLGLTLQMLTLAIQIAGAFLDLQIGFGAAMVLNPLTGQQVSILAQFKGMLAIVLLLVTNAHHLLLEAFFQSYRVVGVTMESLPAISRGASELITGMCLIALQIAAPVAAVCLVIDVAAGVVNKAVPQMQGYLVSMPAKILMGLATLGFAVPLVLVTVQSGIERSFQWLFRMLGG